MHEIVISTSTPAKRTFSTTALKVFVFSKCKELPLLSIVSNVCQFLLKNKMTHPNGKMKIDRPTPYQGLKNWWTTPPTNTFWPVPYPKDNIGTTLGMRHIISSSQTERYVWIRRCQMCANSYLPFLLYLNCLRPGMYNFARGRNRGRMRLEAQKVLKQCPLWLTDWLSDWLTNWLDSFVSK